MVEALVDEMEDFVLFTLEATILEVEVVLLIAEVVFKLFSIDELCVVEVLVGLLDAETWVEFLAVVGLVEILEVEMEILVVPGVEVLVVEVLEFEEEVLEVEPLDVEVEKLVVAVEPLVVEVEPLVVEV